MKDKENSQKNAVNKILTLVIWQAVIVIILVVAVVLLILRKPVVEEYVAVDSSRIYQFYKEGQFIDLDDYTYGKIKVPALSDVPKHSYNYDRLLYDGRYYSYIQNTEKISATGVDISYFQGNIDWDKVKKDGINFAMLRVGYTGYESGAINLDDRFHEYAKGATDAGINIGVYFFSQATDADEAQKEAEMVIDNLKKYDITYPVVFDWEIIGTDSARTNDVSVETVTQCAVRFCDTISDAGYIPMIYANKKCALLKMNLSELAGYHFWYSNFKEEIPTYPYDYQMWQYCSDGKVDGIDTEVDLNISFIDYSKTKPISYVNEANQ